MKNGMLYKAALIEVKAYDDEKREVQGYASVFSNLDSDSDRLMKGSFNRTIKSRGPAGKQRIKLVSQHDIKTPVGRIDELVEDEKGLRMKAVFGTHQAGEDHYRMVKEGILTEFSIGFVPTREEKNDDGGRDFTEVKLYEVSLVTVAANDEALVTSVKSESIQTPDTILDSMLTLVKELDNEDVAFKLERDIYTMKSLVPETTTQPESGVATKEDSLDPVVEKRDDFLTLLDNL